MSSHSHNLFGDNDINNILNELWIDSTNFKLITNTLDNAALANTNYSPGILEAKTILIGNVIVAYCMASPDMKIPARYKDIIDDLSFSKEYIAMTLLALNKLKNLPEFYKMHEHIINKIQTHLNRVLAI